MSKTSEPLYKVDSVVPDFSGEDGTSTPVKSDNVVLTHSGKVSIFPIKRTSRLGLFLLVTGVFAVIPLVIYTLWHVPMGNTTFNTVIAWDIGILLTLLPFAAYLFMQNGNRITVDTSKSRFEYQTALGSSVAFYYTPVEQDFNIVYFSNTSAQSRFNRKGWAAFYRGKEMLFRLNIERWDAEDLWWMAENLPARIMVIHERTGYKYIEKRFPGYFPMFAVKPVLSGILVILGVSALLLIEFLLWALAFHFYGG